MPIFEERIEIPVPGGGPMEGVLAYAESGTPHTAVLLLAPHPQMGGNMDNNVIRHIARRAAEDGALSLRFNYRGVGASPLNLPDGQSVYDYFERMETQQRYDLLLPDARAALAALTRTAACGRIVYTGYSLGTILAAFLAAEIPPDALAAISPPVKKVSLDAFHLPGIQKHFIGGDADFAFLPDRFLAQYAELPPPKSFQLLQGADHFFRKEEERVYEAIRPVLPPL